MTRPNENMHSSLLCDAAIRHDAFQYYSIGEDPGEHVVDLLQEKGRAKTITIP